MISLEERKKSPDRTGRNGGSGSSTGENWFQVLQKNIAGYPETAIGPHQKKQQWGADAIRDLFRLRSKIREKVGKSKH